MLGTVGSSDWVGEKVGTDDPQVIALHGWGRTGVDFEKILQGIPSIAVHLPGFGKSPAPTRAWSPADYADGLAGALSGYPPQVILGHSFGGRIAIRLAARHPSVVKALVLTGVPLTRVTPSRQPALGFRLAKKFHSWGWLSEEVMEAQRQKHGSLDYRQARGVMREILVQAVSEDYLDDAARVRQPTFLVWGEEDKPAPLAGAEISLKYFPNATLRVVPGAGHLLEGSLERDVATAVADALKL
jgi:pimeloyl-ACP methyl ester carboxylesterase